MFYLNVSKYVVYVEDDNSEEVEAAKRVMRNKLFEIANSLSTKRTNLRAEVFKPSHILPKYSVEQAGMIELEEVCNLCSTVATPSIALQQTCTRPTSPPMRHSRPANM